MTEYRMVDGRIVTSQPNGSAWRGRDLLFARRLGEELRARRTSEQPFGSLGHHLATQAAWRKAEERMETEP